MSTLGLLAGEMLLKFAGKKLQDKLGKKPDIKAAAKEVIPSLLEAPISTGTGIALALAALAVGSFDFSPEMAEQITPLIQNILTGVLGLLAAYIATLKKKK